MSSAEYIFDTAEKILGEGGLVILPTETFYAIAADPFQEKALERIFEIKGRDSDKPLPLIAADFNVVFARATVSDGACRDLMNRFWPGSLTILLKASGFSPLLTGPTGKIGVRVPPWSAARILAARIGGLITATSANLAGAPSAARVSEMDPSLLHAVDMVMDLGPAPGGEPSTVVDPMDHDFRVIREGAIPESALRNFLRPRPFT